MALRTTPIVTQDAAVEAYRLRFRAFETVVSNVSEFYPNGEVFDAYDTAFCSTTLFGCYDDDKLVGSFRLSFGERLQFTRYWSDIVPQEFAVEFSRLVIEPSITNPLKRYSILFEMVKRAATVAAAIDAPAVYTTADPKLLGTYKRLFGLSEASPTLMAIPPGKEENIAILHLTLTDTVKRRIAKVFGD